MADRRGGSHQQDPASSVAVLIEQNTQMRASILFSDRAGLRMDALKGCEPDWLIPSERLWGFSPGGSVATTTRRFWPDQPKACDDAWPVDETLTR